MGTWIHNYYFSKTDLQQKAGEGVLTANGYKPSKSIFELYVSPELEVYESGETKEFGDPSVANYCQDWMSEWNSVTLSVVRTSAVSFISLSCLERAQESLPDSKFFDFLIDFGKGIQSAYLVQICEGHSDFHQLFTIECSGDELIVAHVDNIQGISIRVAASFCTKAVFDSDFKKAKGRRSDNVEVYTVNPKAKIARLD